MKEDSCCGYGDVMCCLAVTGESPCAGTDESHVVVIEAFFPIKKCDFKRGCSRRHLKKV